MLKRSYLTLLNLLILVLIVSLSVKAAQIWLPSVPMEEKFEAKNLPVEVRQMEVIKRVRLLLSDYQVIGEQNVFHKERKMPEDPPPPQPSNPAPVPQPVPAPQPEIVNPPSVIFYGTSREGEDMYALIQSTSGQKPKRYRLNEEVDGYMVTEIRRSQVTLSRNGKDFPLKLWGPDASNRPREEPIMQQPVFQQPIVQQPVPIIQYPAGVSSLQDPGTPPRVNKELRGTVPTRRQIIQSVNPGALQYPYTTEQSQPGIANQTQEFEEQDFQEPEGPEEGVSAIPPGMPHIPMPNVPPPNTPFIPPVMPTPFMVPGVNQ